MVWQIYQSTLSKAIDDDISSMAEVKQNRVFIIVNEANQEVQP